MPKCACGCGGDVPVARFPSRQKKYIWKHQHQRYPLYVVEDRGYKTPCWVWQHVVDGRTPETSYGRLSRDGVRKGAHVWFWEDVNGPVPDGLEIDHLCRVPACVNPDHLEAVTSGVNQRRGAHTHLDPFMVQTIRVLVANGASRTWIARSLGVPRARVWSALNNWHDVPEVV